MGYSGKFHGLSYTPEYRVWQTMRHRCTSPNSPAWGRYGGRGITICRRWFDSPESFLADVGPKPFAKSEIDRIDNNKGYTCGHCDDCKAKGQSANCRWTTKSVNVKNREVARRLDLDGEVLNLVDWSKKTGIKRDTIAKRIDEGGMSIRQALTLPVRERSPNGQQKPRPSRGKGLRKPYRKYSTELILSVMRAVLDGWKQSTISTRLEVDTGYVNMIRRRRSHKELWKVAVEQRTRSLTAQQEDSTCRDDAKSSDDKRSQG